ncbi:Txe/YoeB family addiction module toxin [Thiofilum flexile]|uniref:Txe/YoeB family addiction module toxin n=1 Tax=Thiofilum flexile TaxID=125627 RepID=UPI00037E1F18|nr:Txe/YoeB family addiction module toxin [Thiofilum flexile]
MKSLVFEGRTWEAYEQLRADNRVLHKKLCEILKEMLRNDPSQGIGKPEPLRHNLSDLWSRRLSKSDRVIYRFDEDSVYIFAIGGHYDDK